MIQSTMSDNSLSQKRHCEDAVALPVTAESVGQGHPCGPVCKAADHVVDKLLGTAVEFSINYDIFLQMKF